MEARERELWWLREKDTKTVQSSPLAGSSCPPRRRGIWGAPHKGLRPRASEEVTTLNLIFTLFPPPPKSVFLLVFNPCWETSAYETGPCAISRSWDVVIFLASCAFFLFFVYIYIYIIIIIIFWWYCFWGALFFHHEATSACVSFCVISSCWHWVPRFSISLGFKIMIFYHCLFICSL